MDSKLGARALIDAVPSLPERLLDTMASGVVVCDVGQQQHPIVYVNEIFERMTGYSAAESVGRDPRFLQGEGTSPLAVALMRDAVRRCDPITVTVLNYRRDGSDFWNEIRLTPLRSAAEQQARHYLGILTDVTVRAGDDLAGRRGGDPEGLGRRLAGEGLDLQQFADLVEISDDFISITGLDGSVRYVNEAGRRLLGLDSTHPLREATIKDFLSEESWKHFLEVERPAIDRDGRWSGEGALRHVETGAIIPVAVSAYLLRDPQTGDPTGIGTIQRETSRQRAVTDRSRRIPEPDEAHYRSLPLPVYEWRRVGDDFELRDWNAAAEEVSAGAVRELSGVRATDLFAAQPEALAALRRCWSTRSNLTVEMPDQVLGNGEERHLIVTYACAPSDLVLAHTLDITERVASERRLQRLAERDDLTGLYNRRFFESRLAESIGRRDLAVLIIDVDHFKFVNDSLGHGAGDELLREVADTMATRVREGDIVARFGGDEFVVMLAGCDADRARAVGNNLLASIRSNVTGVSVTASAGAAVFTRGETLTASDAIVAADIALYEAKQHGRDRVELYTGQTGGALTWVDRIRSAIAEDRLVLYAQPMLELAAASRLPTYELLVRMLDDRGEIIPPNSFLPTAEQFGLVRAIDRWVVEKGIAFAGAGNRVSINLSARSLGDPGFATWIEQLLTRHATPAENVTFEFTESAAISNVENARSLTLALRELGCWTALDDFGTGVGSFVLLKHIPVNVLKIDIEFVRRLSVSEIDQRIVRAIVQIAHDAGMLTVAEGVQDAGALALVREYGVDFAQGFHLGYPAPVPGGGVSPPG